MRSMRKFLVFGSILLPLIFAYFIVPKVQDIYTQRFSPAANIEDIRRSVGPRLITSLAKANLQLGAPSFIRVFKEEHQLEVWLKHEDTYTLFKSYQICTYSGKLGPKLKEGDRQSPEGFYSVNTSALNPNSSYHLSFNLGFPNAYDQAHSRTGSYLMVHGNCVSIGCYAMTNQSIEEIYLIVEAALLAGQSSVPVHAFPFKMTAERLRSERDNQWYPYWNNLKAGYDLFVKNAVPPAVTVRNGHYIFPQG